MPRRSALLIVLALCPLVPLLGVRTPAASAPSGIRWGGCPADVLAPVPPAERQRLRCARFRVPIEHDRPWRGGIELALMKRLADDPLRRIGSLFTNPGGPGNSGFLPIREAARKYRPEVLRRFDVIGFDPRGVGRSAPLRCFTSAEDKEATLAGFVSVPITVGEIAKDLAIRRDYARACRREAGQLLYHMSTKDTARDLELLRAAVGDRRLNYLGYSYGTLLGATYTAMYPRNTRAMVLDGNVDPLLRTNDGIEHERLHGEAFEFALNAVLERCAAAGTNCAFASGNPRAKFAELRGFLRWHSLRMPDGTVIRRDDFVEGVAEAMWDQDSFAPLMRQLDTAYAVLHGDRQATGSVSLLSGSASRSRYTGDDSYFGVNCSDKPFPPSQAPVPILASAWEFRAPTFARWQAFDDFAQCSVWPAAASADRYSGPWRNRAENPVLTFGNSYDPATPYAFSRKMTRLLGKARLVRVHAFGHTILGGRSKCADRIASEYLVNLRLPAEGTVCEPEHQPFEPIG